MGWGWWRAFLNRKYGLPTPRRGAPSRRSPLICSYKIRFYHCKFIGTFACTSEDPTHLSFHPTPFLSLTSSLLPYDSKKKKTAMRSLVAVALCSVLVAVLCAHGLEEGEVEIKGTRPGLHGYPDELPHLLCSGV